MHLEDGIECLQDLIELGLSKISARVLFKRILAWKQHGLPEDFHIRLVEPTCSSKLSPIFNDKQLDDDFVTARWCKSRVATDRIVNAADAGYHLAEAYLSILYDRDGTLLTKDRSKAEDYAMKAVPWLAENSDNNVFASYTLAMCYANGRSVVKDFDTAAKLSKLAADKGHSSAQLYVGWCFDTGTSYPKDADAAVRYYQLAAAQGNPQAQYNLAIGKANNTSPYANETEAIKFFKLAADLGHADAQFKLGKYFENGAGVAKDEMEAVRYYLLATDQGHVMARLKKRFLASRLRAKK